MVPLVTRKALRQTVKQTRVRNAKITNATLLCVLQLALQPCVEMHIYWVRAFKKSSWPHYVKFQWAIYTGFSKDLKAQLKQRNDSKRVFRSVRRGVLNKYKIRYSYF